MKIEKINKGKGRRVAILMFAILAMGSLVACAPEVTHAASTDKPAVTQTIEQTSIPIAVSTNTPNPTPTNIPTPSPMPELTLEQKTLLLGIGKESGPSEIGQIQAYNYDLNGKKYRFWAFSVHNKEKSKKSNGDYVEDVFDAFNNQYMFSLNFPNNGVDKDGQGYTLAQAREFLSETNPALNGMKIELAFGLLEIAQYYTIWEVDYNNDEFLNGLGEIAGGQYSPEVEAKIEQMRQTMLPLDKMKEVFLNSTPQEEIMPYWVYTPGAIIPEELKGIYSEVDYPPASAETTVQQSNRIYGYKELVDDNVTHGYRIEDYYNQGYTKTKI